MINIPCNKPCFAGHERQYVEQAVANGPISDDGKFALCCQAFRDQAPGAAKALLATPCTHALEMAALLLRVDCLSQSPPKVILQCMNIF